MKRGRELLDHGQDRQDELNDLLGKLDELQAQARTDVDLTKATLKDANEIYKTLKGKIWRSILTSYDTCVKYDIGVDFIVALT